jgi:hypothetical protein
MSDANGPRPQTRVFDRRQILTGGAALVGAGVVGSAYNPAGAAAARNMPAAVQGARRSAQIRAENAKPGTTDWLLTRTRRGYHEVYGKGWDVRTGVQGFASHMSITAGATLRFFVSAEPADEYRLDIYRMGYYGGSGGRLIRTFDGLKGTPQPMPTDGEHAIQECRWQEAVSLQVPESWLSGVYLGKLTTARTNADAFIVFIVRDTREADLIFQCSDFTWQSYNRWPRWRSMYDGPTGPWVSRRPDSYSAGFDRPYAIYWNGFPAGFEAQSNGSGEFLLWELPLAFWLEQEGYDVTYISNLDTHEDAAGLLRGRAWLSVGHDEYWTIELYNNVLAARDAGVHLAFLSGNSVSGRIALLTGSDGRRHRGIRWVPGPLDATELMGARSYGVGFGDWICAAPDHWIFEGTGMQKGDFVRQLVGWEFHGHPVAAQHKDLVVLAEGSVRGFRGEASQRRFATTLYSAPKGNLVFNAATCWWNMVLAAPPGHAVPPFLPERDLTRFHEGDDRVRRITRNLLDRMIAAKVR